MGNTEVPNQGKPGVSQGKAGTSVLRRRSEAEKGRRSAGMPGNAAGSAALYRA